jgi:hypothetical protein
MNRINMIFIAISIVIFSMAFTFYSPQNAPEVSAKVTKKSYKPGESGVIVIKFKTSAGIKIPKEPEISVSLNGNSVVGKGVQDYTKGAGEYLSDSSIKYNFSIPKNAKSGSTITVNGKVKFGYCTIKDGICRLVSKDFTAKVKVQ